MTNDTWRLCAVCTKQYTPPNGDYTIHTCSAKCAEQHEKDMAEKERRLVFQDGKQIRGER